VKDTGTKLVNAWVVRFTHPIIRSCRPFAVLWGVTATGDVACASEPEESVGNTINTRDGIFEIQGELMRRDDIPLYYREALCLGVTPMEVFEFVLVDTPAPDVLAFALAKRLKRKFKERGEEEQEGMGL